MQRMTDAQYATYRSELATLVRAGSVSSTHPDFDQSNHGVLEAIEAMARARGGRVQWFEVSGGRGAQTTQTHQGAQSAHSAHSAQSRQGNQRTQNKSKCEGAAVGSVQSAGAAAAAPDDAVGPDGAAGPNALTAMAGQASRAKSNLVASFGRGPGGLVLSGHSDTVPCNPDRWDTDPLVLTERDARLYGLGSADMKAFFPAALAAIDAVGPSRLTRTVHLIATADEESTMAGARALLDAGLDLGTAAVIGEPTELRPIRLHKGVMMLEIAVLGRAGHASNPALGHNALEAMHQVIAALLDYRAREFSQLENLAFPVPRPTLNLGAIRGGDSPNRICGRCTLSVDVRLLPGQDPHAVQTALASLVQAAVVGTGCSVTVAPLVEPVPPMHTAADGPLVGLCEHLAGREAGAVNFATEGPFFNLLGLETVILGAGSIDQAHQPNEFVARSQIEALVPRLARMIAHFCIA